MDTGVGDKTLFICDVKKCSMGDARLICHSPGVSIPRVEMCVKMNHRDWPIDFIERTEDRENDGMVTTKTRPLGKDMMKGV